jgi:hypothetical protein
MLLEQEIDVSEPQATERRALRRNSPSDEISG